MSMLAWQPACNRVCASCQAPLPALGFMRRNGGKGAASAGLTAGQHSTIDQWESEGNVATVPAAASQGVPLGESTRAQAHVGQACVLSAQDSFLIFTVSGLDLQTNISTL